MVLMERPHWMRWTENKKLHEMSFDTLSIAASLYGIVLSRSEDPTFLIKHVEAGKSVIAAYKESAS